LTDIGKIIEIL
jgi:hypothetical protein